jgi:predicted ABC-type ATPase
MSIALPGRVCRIIAGPNGAGKTTFALKYLPQMAPGTAFINADLIAAGLSPLAPEKQSIAASRLFLQQIEHHVVEGRDFAFETTLSGRRDQRLIRRLRSAAWRVELVYLALPSVELSRLRVAERVAHGGHSIAPVDIVRRSAQPAKSSHCVRRRGGPCRLLSEQRAFAGHCVRPGWRQSDDP